GAAQLLGLVGALEEMCGRAQCLETSLALVRDFIDQEQQHGKRTLDHVQEASVKRRLDPNVPIVRMNRAIPKVFENLEYICLQICGPDRRRTLFDSIQLPQLWPSIAAVYPCSNSKCSSAARYNAIAAVWAAADLALYA
ncbi:MAG TPA: hypothetical protein VIV15_12745, partial [Anaerolineales bacterium]